MNTAAHRLKGLGYLLTLLTLLIGIPTALYLFQGNPLAPLAELTSFNALKELLLTQDDGTLFITALTLLGWSAWATFAYTTIIEIVAAARGARPEKSKDSNSSNDPPPPSSAVHSCSSQPAPPPHHPSPTWQ